MMSRWCDQSIPDERHSAFSSGPLEVAVLFGTLVAETILASAHVRALQTGRTYGRKRSDQSTAKHLARRGPSTYVKYGQSGVAADMGSDPSCCEHAWAF